MLIIGIMMMLQLLVDSLDILHLEPWQIDHLDIIVMVGT